MLTAPTCIDCGDTKWRLTPHRVTGERHRVACACTVGDLSLRLVYQRHKADCVVAALATAMGRTYDDVRHRIDLSHDFTVEGTSLEGVACSVLDHFGFAWQLRYRTTARLNYAERDPWPCAPWADAHICEVTNLPNCTRHAVVLLRDGRVLDPFWGVVQGLYRYPAVHSMLAVYPIAVGSSAQADGVDA
ncbi:MAG: hypothetical protein ACREBE_04935 [bacterium]